MRHPILLLILAAVALLIGGCTDEQIRQAEAVAASAAARADQAAQAVEIAREAVARADELAKQLGNVQAEQVVAQARSALEAATVAGEAAQAAAKVATDSVAAAKAAQEAGGGVGGVIVAATGGVVAALPAILALALKLAAAVKAFRQTVAGIEAAKESMPTDQIAKLHAALAEKQDAKVKQQVALAKSLPAVALLFLAIGLAPAADVGLGPVPLSSSMTAPGPIGTGTPSSGAFTTVTASSTVIVGPSSQDVVVAGSAVTPDMQVNDTSAGGTTASNTRWSNNANGPSYVFGKSRGAAVGTHTIVADNDFLGRFAFDGSDGVQFREAARLIVEVDGTPGSGDMPGRMVFLTTPDGSANPVERARIDNKGNVTIGAAAIATTATDGFLYVPTCAGTPTGVPTTKTGRGPIVIDSTNNKLYFYSGGAWRDAGP